MNTTEFKVGQKWRVVDAEEFNSGLMSFHYVDECRVVNGDVIQLVGEVGKGWSAEIVGSASKTLTDESDRDMGLIEIIEDPTEASEDNSPEYTISAPEDVKNVSQETTDSSKSKDILWHIISRASKYNGHSQLEISEMDLSTLITLTRMLDDYVEEFCEMRLSWAGDHMGYYTADIYEIKSAAKNTEDKILLMVEKVTGV